eukprot:CAMPEP_0204829582 /NCGR_PEP_ID=MMETSP1346-20131115/7832_1 /ASSEMBLY_ACC=CAM_ASM_000771 /TAXON_ID=215587 /ORGANISM="Aplanochytrium stocchinoi, Strain GSBS06" /LENGTH=44 /DNA_ID= /DNA_START= /DNA_END= /DNA_ORIENTATION=
MDAPMQIRNTFIANGSPASVISASVSDRKPMTGIMAELIDPSTA